jgi:hypothetical protein
VALAGQARQGVVILAAWSLWNLHNRCVFDGVLPNLSNLLSATMEEMRLWSLAGAKEISYLAALSHNVSSQSSISSYPPNLISELLWQN